ncbi:Crp/Fnr family transcriptional regulator [Hydrogenophaga sp.]|uniref:Crp/Fnr family transcriptional regulator n=1 Tax=Hydrogenophaga sp. TaxID=1904254 RepID=UPI003D12FA25
MLPLPQHEPFRSLVRERTVAVGEMLEIQGTQGQMLGVVKVGLLKGLRSRPGDEGKPILLMGKGRLIGFTQPFGQAALLSLAAITPTRVCEIDVRAVRDLAMHHEPFQQAIYRTIAEFLGIMADWSRLLREDSYLTKVAAALQLIAAEAGSASFRIPSHTELANVLGARRETVARHIAILIDKGLFKKVDRWHGMLTTTDAAGPEARY